MDSTDTTKKRTRIPALFPKNSIPKCIELAEGIQKHASGEPMSRLTLLDKLGLNPTTGAVRVKITASNQYGITDGSYNASQISLTSIGAKIVNATSKKTRIEALFEVFNSNDKFREFYEKWIEKRVPEEKILVDSAKSTLKFDDSTSEAFVPIFLENCRYIGLIEEISGSNHFISLEAALKNIPASESKEVSSVDSNAETVEQTIGSKRSNPQILNPILNIALHINISPEASIEQIEKVFECMAKYIYKND